MLRNYLSIALRQIRRYKGYSLINISGLSVGIACCLLIVLYVQDELSFDRFHDHGDRIRRVSLEFTQSGESWEQLATPSAVGPVLQREFPEIDRSVRVFTTGIFGPVVLSHKDRLFQERRLLYADSTFFDIFSFPFLIGNPKSALSRPNTMVLTNSMAQKYFGDTNPIGKVLTRDNRWDLEITGVIEDIPGNSHLHFDFMASYSSLTNSWASNEVWHSANLVTYVLFKSEAGVAKVEQKLPALVEREIGATLKASGDALAINLQPLTEIHLHSNLGGETNGDITIVYTFSAIALLILLIACVNYMNLATARATRRAREVGVRKVLGAFRAQIRNQFFGESALTALIALGLAALLLEFLLPLFNDLAGKQLTIEYFQNPVVLFSLLTVGLVVTLLAGSYPALFLSAFQPIRVLKSSGPDGGYKSSFRNKLVVFQFAVSAILIVATLVVKSQLDYVRNKKLGFDKERVVILSIADQTLQKSLKALKAELVSHSDVLSVAATDGYPGNQRAGYSAAAEGLQQNEYPLAGGMIADPDVLETLGIELLAGPGFPETYTPEQGYYYVVNEVLLRRLGWQAHESIGRWLDLQSNRKGAVVGVAKDFHFMSLHNAIEPLAIFLSPNQWDYDNLLVKVGGQDLRGTLDFIEDKWRSFAPHRPFEYVFLDREFDALYRSEERLGQIFLGFSLFAISIACLGLFGLASFVAEQRTKEIGIRKTLGATVPEVLLLLSRDFTKLIAVAFLVAAPVAYFVLNSWLENFAYRIEVGVGSFLVGGAIVALLALATVSYQSVRAALTNPVNSLRNE